MKGRYKMKEYKNGKVTFDLEELNLISIYAHEAAIHYEAINCPMTSKEAIELSDKLYKICEKHGMYTDL